jgi:uncharacterized protein YlxW (UPF0749 family)
MRSRGSQAALTIIFVLFGFMLATQFRARPPIAGNLPYQRAEELSVLLKVTEEQRDSLKEEVAALRDQVAKMQAGEDQVKVLQGELMKAMILAGLTDVKGPGVVVEMNDSQKPSQAGQNPNVFLIHERDLQDVINAIFGAGAEAVSVNGQRFVSTTEVVCAGNVIMINGVRVAPPFNILAIGDPSVLESGLKMRGGVVDTLKLWEIEVKVKVDQEITIPAYQGSLKFRFVQPAQKEETK